MSRVLIIVLKITLAWTFSLTLTLTFGSIIRPVTPLKSWVGVLKMRYIKLVNLPVQRLPLVFPVPEDEVNSVHVTHVTHVTHVCPWGRGEVAGERGPVPRHWHHLTRLQSW